MPRRSIGIGQATNNFLIAGKRLYSLNIGVANFIRIDDGAICQIVRKPIPDADGGPFVI
jgi:hypothetical protein